MSAANSAAWAVLDTASGARNRLNAASGPGANSALAPVGSLTCDVMLPSSTARPERRASSRVSHVTPSPTGRARMAPASIQAWISASDVRVARASSAAEKMCDREESTVAGMFDRRYGGTTRLRKIAAELGPGELLA